MVVAIIETRWEHKIKIDYMRSTSTHLVTCKVQ
jgi:hypothetical protein